MPWLIERPLPSDARRTLETYLGELAERLDDPSLDRNIIVRDELARLMHGVSFDELEERRPMAALALDPRQITFEAEYYIATDQDKFAQVKPLLWFWKCLDQTPLGQSVASGVPIRRMLAERIFKRVGKNLKIFQNVEVSVGYNIEVGDNVVIHRHVLIDDIGGVILHDDASISDYVNIYSHTHDVLESADVTLKQTVIGKGVRVAYHATVLAGTILSDDSMMGAFALATHNFEPHVIGLGIPAKPRIWKERAGDPRFAKLSVDSRQFTSAPEVRANPDFASAAEKKRS
jgi:galactoside O-acetyltransferase